MEKQLVFIDRVWNEISYWYYYLFRVRSLRSQIYLTFMVQVLTSIALFLNLILGRPIHLTKKFEVAAILDLGLWLHITIASLKLFKKLESKITVLILLLPKNRRSCKSAILLTCKSNVLKHGQLHRFKDLISVILLFHKYTSYTVGMSTLHNNSTLSMKLPPMFIILGWWNVLYDI